jgi:ABC-type multidrug transport system ATPase subunit
MVFRGGNVSQQMKPDASAQPQLLMQLTFGGKQELTIGRDDNNDVKLDGLQISNRHARLLQSGSSVAIEDLNSTNGVYVNGQKISRQNISTSDAVQIGSFVIRVDNAGNIGVFDTRSKTRIDSVNITKEVKDRSGGGTLKLLDGVSLTIMPNEFVGLLGPSGAGKSTFMDALNGMRPASGGSVLVNNLDLYQNLDALKQSIGYVPQDDIIHRELTVYRTLYYVAKLRLSTDVSRKEIDQIVNEVMDVTGLSERRDVPINQLSGGQRKRVSIAVELVTKPSVIYLDEPTSGLDPATEEKIMILFRQIAESGRTVILTTHAMENVKLFDKIVLLMRGKLVFYGKPQEALEHVGAKSFKELYDKLEEPIEQRLAMNGASRHQVTEQVAEEWKQKFTKTPQYKKNVFEPLRQIGQVQSQGVQQKRKLGVFGAVRQWMTLSRRYWEVLVRDKFNLLILFIQAPIVALLTFFVMDKDQPRDFVYFVLSLVSVWFGTSVAAREIIREKAVYTRERMVNLGLMPYVFSKLFILGVIVGIQCILLFLPLKFFDLVGLMQMPGELAGIPQFWVMLLTASVGIALGLFISATVKTSEMATSLVPLILIPQILFSGLVGVPTGINKVAGLIMPATWSFDTMKRFSTLDTLKEEGADESGETRGVGYYKYVEQENDKLIADSRKKIDDYKAKSEQKMKDYEKEMKDDLAAGQRPGDMPKLDAAPKIGDPKKIDKNLSAYVNFLHPWMNEVLNQIVLMIMFFMLVIATLIVLRMQDIA